MCNITLVDDGEGGYFRVKEDPQEIISLIDSAPPKKYIKVHVDDENDRIVYVMIDKIISIVDI